MNENPHSGKHILLNVSVWRSWNMNQTDIIWWSHVLPVTWGKFRLIGCLIQAVKGYIPSQGTSGCLELRLWGTRLSFGQAIGSVHTQARHLLPREMGSKHSVQHSQHFQEVLLVVDFSLQQILETQKLAVHDGRLANDRPINVQDHLSCYDEDRGEPGVNQVPGEESVNDYLHKFNDTDVPKFHFCPHWAPFWTSILSMSTCSKVNIQCDSLTLLKRWVTERLPVRSVPREHFSKFLFDPSPW